MNRYEMTSMERVLTTLSHKEPDRVPFFLLLTMHGAKELGMSIKEYFSSAENVTEGQLILHKKYRSDCLYSFFYAPIEVEAWGGEVIFRDDGPPNSGTPFIRCFKDIEQLKRPVVENNPILSKVLKTTKILKSHAHDDVPIIGTVMSPFSIPVMQMGFDKYLELLYERPELFKILMELNEDFCVEWANAQLKAGATAICYFDPVSSSTIITKEQYLNFGFPVAKRTIARINGPTATHMASGRCLPIIKNLAKTGTGAIGVSVLEDITKLKNICKDKLTVIGNLNGIEMRHWTQQEAEKKVKDLITMAGTGGGFILSDNHGEIPYQVPDKVLKAISDAVHKWGTYPLLSK